MLVPPHPHLSYFDTNDSSPTGGAGTSVTSSGSANAYGTWTQIHAGLTYPSEWVLINLNNNFSNNSNRNSYVDIGIGPDSSNVTVVIEKLAGGMSAANVGRVYSLPIRIPPDTIIWARHQCASSSTAVYVQFTVFGGNANSGTIPVVSRAVCLGATTASTVGTSISVGGSGAEGNWTEIVSSTTEDYSGLMIGVFTTDTGWTALPAYSFDASIGSSGQELTVGENLTQWLLATSTEASVSNSIPTFLGIPTGSRLCIRGSCSGTAETGLSVVLYAFTH